MRLRRSAAASTLTAAFALALAAPVWSQEKAAIDAESERVLRAMSDWYTQQQGLSTTAELSIEQSFKGQEMKTTRQYDLAFQRPNKLAVEVKADGRSGQVVSDGKQVTVYVQQLGKYVTKPAPAKLAELLERREVMAIGGEPLGIAGALFTEDPYKAITESVTAVKYTGKGKVGDADAHRLRLESGENATEAYVSAGDRPVLLKLVADTSSVVERAKAAGQEVKLDVAMVYGEWKSGDVEEARFAFDAPAGAEAAKSLFDEPKHPLSGRMAPDFKLAKLDGSEVELARHKGKEIVILDFWATWCGPCVQAMPVLAEVANKYKDKGVVFYAVNQQEGRAEIEPFLKARKLDIMVLLDRDGGVGQSYGVRGIPQTVIIDKSGNVARVHVGFSPDMKTSLTHDLDALLAGKKLTDE